MTTRLRPHQERAIAALRASLASGKRRPVLQAPTGAGKTVIAAAITKSAVEKGKRVIFTCPAISLIDQTVDKFEREGIDSIGVMQANHWRTNPNARVQIASVQTLARRKTPDADLVIVDEGHNQFSEINKWIKHPEWAKIPFIGLSATPWARGMGQYWDDLIVVARTPELIEQGYLVPIVGYAPSRPNVAHVRVTAGDFNKHELSEAVNERKLVADIVESWLRLGEGRPTIAFAVDRKHARAIQQDFNESGIQCEYIDAMTEVADRNAIGRRLQAGETKVVVSVGCLIVGLDWTFVSCIIHARPTQSEMLWVQSVGRGLRTHEGKTNCILLDHADNYNRLGIPELIHYDKLDDGRQRKKSKVAPKVPDAKVKARECKKCGAIRQPGQHKCHVCGYEPLRLASIETIEGDLVSVSGKDANARREAIKNAEKEIWYSAFLHIAFEKQYKPGWAAVQFKEKFGHWPEYKKAFPIEPPPAVRNWIRYRNIKRARARLSAFG